MPFILVNPDSVDLCKYCPELFCRKAIDFHKDFPNEIMDICPSYKGNIKWYNHNVKTVSREDFEKYGNEGFEYAKRIETK